MHIAEGILAPEVLAVGAVISAAGVAYGLHRTSEAAVPRVAVAASAFFVASLIHVPLGPASVHLVLSGLMGVVLGWAAFPAVLVALLLQAVFFGFGGFTVLGVNTLIMAGPAVLMGAVLRPGLAHPHGAARATAGFIAGAGAILLGAALASVALAGSGKAFQAAAAALLLGHVPVALIEGFVTGAVVSFLARVRPDILEARLTPAEGAAHG
jgi:cobalt/nickel transport system permease protein